MLSFANGRSSPERADGLPYPVYGSNGVIGHASEANADQGSIIIGRVGSYCGSLYLSKQRSWVTDNAIRATPLDNNDARFLFYVLGTLGLNHWRAGSGQPLLNQDILSRIPATIPEPAQQRAIAHILGTLDDKIELNRRMNHSLEALARALFQSWFVDFDPVTAKVAGRQPVGMSADTARLFRRLSKRKVVITGLYGGTDWGPADAWLTSPDPAVLICTYEKGEALMRFLGPQFMSRVTLVVLDEAHSIRFDGDHGKLATADSRAFRLESLGMRLLGMLEANKVRVIALSAVATGIERPLQSWVTKDWRINNCRGY